MPSDAGTGSKPTQTAVVSLLATGPRAVTCAPAPVPPNGQPNPTNQDDAVLCVAKAVSALGDACNALLTAVSQLVTMPVGPVPSSSRDVQVEGGVTVPVGPETTAVAAKFVHPFAGAVGSGVSVPQVDITQEEQAGPVLPVSPASPSITELLGEDRRDARLPKAQHPLVLPQLPPAFAPPVAGTADEQLWPCATGGVFSGQGAATGRKTGDGVGLGIRGPAAHKLGQQSVVCSLCGTTTSTIGSQTRHLRKLHKLDLASISAPAGVRSFALLPPWKDAEFANKLAGSVAEAKKWLQDACMTGRLQPVVDTQAATVYAVYIVVLR